MRIEMEEALQKAMQPWYDKYPDMRSVLLEEAQLFVDEVESGGSWENEMSHLIDSLNDNVGEV